MTKCTGRQFICIAVFMLYCLPLTIQCFSLAVVADEQSVAEIIARDDLYTKGSQQLDVKVLASVWADTFIDTSGTGEVRNKEQMLSAIAEEKAKGAIIMSLLNSERRTDVYGNAAVVTGMYTATAREDGREVVEKGRFTDVWVRQNGIWMCVAAHSSPIKQISPTSR